MCEASLESNTKIDLPFNLPFLKIISQFSLAPMNSEKPTAKLIFPEAISGR